jgi:hypothetical protein
VARFLRTAGLVVPLALFALAAAGGPDATGAEGLLAARAQDLKPVTLENGKPKFQIPPESRLGRNEHPRFLLTKEDLETLKKRLADPRIAAQFEALKKRCASRYPSDLERALLYRLTGEKSYLDALKGPGVRSWKPEWIWEWAAMVDLVWDDLSAEERRGLSDAVAKAVAKDGAFYWRTTLPVVSVFYEGGQGPNDRVFLERIRRDFDETVVRWTEKLNLWSAGRGGSDMGHGYNGEHAYWEPFTAAIAWSHATGEDYIARAVFTRYQSPFYWYHFLPGLDPLCVEKIGVTRSADDPGAVTPAHCGANHLLFLTFTRENDGLGLAWMERFRQTEPNWLRDREALGRLLWWDPEQKPLDPATLPTTRLFPTSGHVVMRSDWSPDATFATFRCGRFGEIDGGWGRNNADNLSFTIRKRGPLAIDSGPVHGQNTQVLKFPGEGSDSGIPAIGNYGRQTIAHNSLTLGDDEFTHRDWQGKPTQDVVRRGGQSVPQAPDWWKKWGFPAPQEFLRDGFRQGRITAYRTHPLYDYALGDARFSYPPETVEGITRQFVYLKPDVFVVYDRIVLADATRKPCWLLHSLREPKAADAERALTPAEIGPQWLWSGKEKVPHPEPGGHFRVDGDVFWVESGSPGKKGDGWLKVRTLLPAGAAAERKKIGGKWHDFEVGGVQYGPSEEGYRMADDPYAVLSTIGVLGWRVELRSRESAKTVEFLHVLQAGTGDRSAAGDATLKSTPQEHTVSLEHGGRTFVLVLSRTGPTGALKVTDAAGKVLYEGALPDSIEDHWRYYKEDARYRTWVTDPAYRVVIEPKEEDRALVK